MGREGRASLNGPLPYDEKVTAGPRSEVPAVCSRTRSGDGEGWDVTESAKLVVA
jgi:hypothetical protein